jgi:hypothetical protein
MSLFVASFFVFVFAVGGMAIGVIKGRRAIQGSCGGLNAPGKECAGCGRDAGRCPARRQTRQCNDEELLTD